MSAPIASNTNDPFSFWSMSPTELRTDDDKWIHPEDRQDIGEVFDYHGRYLHTMPAPMFGPLARARLVLAYAGPGNTAAGEENDYTQIKDSEWIKRRVASFDGNTAIDWNLIQPRARKWFRSRLLNILGFRQAEKLPSLENDVAFVNLAAYRGEVTKWDEVAFLPSTHVMREWARTVLFPDARNQVRVVLVMRANKWWGAKGGVWQVGGLFAPTTNRSGFLVSNCRVAQSARSAARNILGLDR